jgi:putative hemolysin
MRFTARRMASRLVSSPKWQAVPRGFLALRALRDGRGANFPIRKPDKVYGKVGNLEVRLARKRREIRLAQRLRYEVFYEEMSAVPSLRAELRRRDEDPYDAVCDHLLVVDDKPYPAMDAWGGLKRQKIVGTYRVLRQEIAERTLGFYTQSEYDIARIIVSWSWAALAFWSPTETSVPSSCSGTGYGRMCASIRST